MPPSGEVLPDFTLPGSHGRLPIDFVEFQREVIIRRDWTCLETGKSAHPWLAHVTVYFAI